jgi:hypothetical protein
MTSPRIIEVGRRRSFAVVLQVFERDQHRGDIAAGERGAGSRDAWIIIAPNASAGPSAM